MNKEKIILSISIILFIGVATVQRLLQVNNQKLRVQQLKPHYQQSLVPVLITQKIIHNVKIAVIV